MRIPPSRRSQVFDTASTQVVPQRGAAATATRWCKGRGRPPAWGRTVCGRPPSAINARTTHRACVFTREGRGGVFLRVGKGVGLPSRTLSDAVTFNTACDFRTPRERTSLCPSFSVHPHADVSRVHMAVWDDPPSPPPTSYLGSSVHAPCARLDGYRRALSVPHFAFAGQHAQHRRCSGGVGGGASTSLLRVQVTLARGALTHTQRRETAR